MTLHFVVDHEKVYFTFDFDITIARQLKQIPEQIRQFDSKLGCWVFPIEKIPDIKKYFEIPPDIMQKYHDYEATRRNEALLPDFEITVNATYCHLKLLKKIPNFDAKFLYDTCSFEVKGAKYTSAYKTGDWDGIYRLFNKDKLSFPTGLLPLVCEALDVDMYEYRIKNRFIEPKIHQIEFIPKNVAFRDYQLDAINSAWENKRGILQLATGGGKTLLATGIIEKFGVKTLFMVHTKDLLYQAYRVFKRTFPNNKIGIIGDGNCEIGDITIATVQTVSQNLANDEEVFGDWNYDIEQEYDEEEIEVIRSEKPTKVDSKIINQLMSDTGLLFCDECQIIPSKTSYKIVMKCQTPFRFGLSATPFRDDGFDMKIQAGLGKIFYKLSASELILKHILVKPFIKFIQIPQANFPKKHTYPQVYKEYIVDNTLRNDVISSIALKERDNGNQILILVKQIRHLNVLHDMIPESIAIQGSMGGEERKSIIQDFIDKKFHILIATSIADVGLDVPNLNCLILAGSGKSSTKALQRIGRVIRAGDSCPKCRSTDIRIKSMIEPCLCNVCHYSFPYHGKEKAIVYDFIDQCKFLYDQTIRRKSMYQTEPEFAITNHKIKEK